MIAQLLIIIAGFQYAAAGIPNNFPTYLSAREASKKSNKPMLIFISSPGCTSCDAAWNAFTSDPEAVRKYISTRVESQDFDGRVIADMFGPQEAPGWIIQTTDGKEQENWSGGWKDAAGNPTKFNYEKSMPSSSEVSQAVKPSSSNFEKKPTPPSSETMVIVDQSTPAIKEQAQVKPTEKKAEPAVATKTTPSPSTPPPAPVVKTKPVTSDNGYVLQAGYFGSASNAEKCASELKDKGLGEYSLKPTSQNGTTYYRVISPVYENESDAKQQLDEVNNKGVKATLKRTTEL